MSTVSARRPVVRVQLRAPAAAALAFVLLAAQVSGDRPTESPEKVPSLEEVFSSPFAMELLDTRTDCSDAFRSDPIFSYNPATAGVSADLRVPGSSFKLRGATCDATAGAEMQLSEDLPENGEPIFRTIVDLIPDNSALYLYHAISVNNSLTPLCESETAGEGGANGSVAIRQLMIGLGNGSAFKRQSTDPRKEAVTFHPGVPYAALLVSLSETREDAVCVFQEKDESSSRTKNGSLSGAPATSDSGGDKRNGGNIDGGTIAGIVIGAVAGVALLSGVMGFYGRRRLAEGRMDREDERRSGPRLAEMERASSVYDNLEEVAGDSIEDSFASNEGNVPGT
jgi:hypothetical protein